MRLRATIIISSDRQVKKIAEKIEKVYMPVFRRREICSSPQSRIKSSADNKIASIFAHFLAQHNIFPFLNE